MEWTAYEADDNPPYLRPVIFIPRQFPMKALELKDVYKPPMRSTVARLELVSAQHTHCLIDATSESMLALPIGERFAHFTVPGSPPPQGRKPDTPDLPQDLPQMGTRYN
jgi:hypothetical protein